ncbi:microfibril associated protein 5 [Entelurus aequoreus]|uniref:microfibril associated protein 5 n=1 Tax=Entelurus aequoreus TaxID=161455 RepID=UPI002B1DE18B|nr:microfibril associated protein 5 [Entelurus aequoreus]
MAVIKREEGGGEKKKEKKTRRQKIVRLDKQQTFSEEEVMGIFPVVLLLCGLHAGVQIQDSEITPPPAGNLPANCREEMYPCTRMYSVHRPIKRCIGGLCLYSLPRVYVINKEICSRTVCRHDEDVRAEICRELSGWPRRVQRSPGGKRCRHRRGDLKTWASQA